MYCEPSFHYRHFLGMLADFSQGKFSCIPWEDHQLIIQKSLRPKGILLKILVVPFDEITREIRSFFTASHTIKLDPYGPELVLDQMSGSVYLCYLLPYPLTYLTLKKALVEFDASLKQWKEIFLC